MNNNNEGIDGSRRALVLLGMGVGLQALLAPVLASTTVTVGSAILGGPLQQAASMTPRAAQGMLTRVVTAGNRLVAMGERGLVVLSDDGGRQWRQAQVPVSVTLTMPPPALPVTSILAISSWAFCRFSCIFWACCISWAMLPRILQLLCSRVSVVERSDRIRHHAGTLPDQPLHVEVIEKSIFGRAVARIAGALVAWVVAGAGVIMIVLGVLPKAGAVVAAIPSPVLGGASLAPCRPRSARS